MDRSSIYLFVLSSIKIFTTSSAAAELAAARSSRTLPGMSTESKHYAFTDTENDYVVNICKMGSHAEHCRSPDIYAARGLQHLTSKKGKDLNAILS